MKLGKDKKMIETKDRKVVTKPRGGLAVKNQFTFDLDIIRPNMCLACSIGDFYKVLILSMNCGLDDHIHPPRKIVHLFSL